MECKLVIIAVFSLFLSQACLAENVESISNKSPHNEFLQARSPDNKIEGFFGGWLTDASENGGGITFIISQLLKHGRVLNEEIVKPIVEEGNNIGRSLVNVSKSCIGFKTSREGGRLNLQIGKKTFTWACGESLIDAVKTIVLAVVQLLPNVGKAAVQLIISVLRDVFGIFL